MSTGINILCCKSKTGSRENRKLFIEPKQGYGFCP